MYPFKKIEKKWQKIWAKNNFKQWQAVDLNKKIKRYVLLMFPYPSGQGLHVGHIEGYAAGDILSRFLRMKAVNVLHPMGWDAFGLPAENYAIKTKTHPIKVVAKNVKNFKKQLKSMGFSYDWSREINTTDPDYYKFTQWIFLQFFKKGLAYEALAPVNWCPSCKTVLANEEASAGRCERCGCEVEQKNLKQWFLKITAYADRLLNDLNELDWPEPIKEMQRNWIGRSEGAFIKFPITNAVDLEIKIFTTRPDTIFGAAYIVLSPEHELVLRLKNKITNWNDVENYLAVVSRQNERNRVLAKEKTGVELKGVKAVNPANGKEISVWIADYVLAGYGAGAIMAVPAHDERDFEFAQKFNLPIIQVIKPVNPKSSALNPLPYINDGEMMNSSQLNGLSNLEAKEKIIKILGAEKKVQYKLRDWVFSRQRYWGEPIPIIKCLQCGNVAAPENDLPIKLPNVKKYQPTGRPESPLAAIEKWIRVKCPVCGRLARRETNTMPQWAGSSWYHLAYLLGSKNLKLKNKNLSDKNFRKLFNYWLPVDIYIGGVEHAVLHLLYARFWHKFLFDLGVVAAKEPFQKLVNQGLIMGPDGQKMSKSKGNIINPDDLIKEFGADSLRLYEMFIGPLEDVKFWDAKGIIGMFRFLTRVYKLSEKLKTRSGKKRVPNNNLERLLNQTVKKITQDIENFKFNTAISALMILVNELEKQESLAVNHWSSAVKLLFPFAPHLAQELWQNLGKKTLLDQEPWPLWDDKIIAVETFQLIIQINGKVRDKIEAIIGLSESEAKDLAFNRPRIQFFMESKVLQKIIYIPNRLINIVAVK